MCDEINSFPPNFTKNHGKWIWRTHDARISRESWVAVRSSVMSRTHSIKFDISYPYEWQYFKRMSDLSIYQPNKFVCDVKGEPRRFGEFFSYLTKSSDFFDWRNLTAYTIYSRKLTTIIKKMHSKWTPPLVFNFNKKNDQVSVERRCPPQQEPFTSINFGESNYQKTTIFLWVEICAQSSAINFQSNHVIRINWFSLISVQSTSTVLNKTTTEKCRRI